MTIPTSFKELSALAAEYDHTLPDLILPAGHPGSGSVARFIDHTLLKPEATPTQVRQVCMEARGHHFASVCVNSVYIGLVAQELQGSSVVPCATIGFPLGATLTAIKAKEAALSVELGAREVDMVIPIGLLRTSEWQAVAEDIAAVVEASHAGGAIVKVILEMCLLDRKQKIMGCLLSQWAKADFVKTSTGFSTGGATLEDVELMRRVVGPQMGVKAAGGIRSLADAYAMLHAGATRLGTSAGLKLVAEEEGA